MSRVVAALGVFGAASVLGSCTDEKIVFRDRVLFEDPPAAALGFLGYSDQEDKLTVCGNCHIGQQSGWEETAHSDAWATLQESGSAQAFCEGCHTISEFGNVLAETAGYNAVPDERYHDVQCESCHGPGLAHVENPDAEANHPLASIAVGTDLTTGCGECHSGTHHPFVEEWEASPHGSVLSYPAGRSACQGCHEGKGILAAWGVKDNYLEKGTGELYPITCAVCHDPHEVTNPGQLRFPVRSASLEDNLCAKCHNRRTEPDPGSSHGLEPHAPQAALLVGDAGWFPPGANIDQGQIIGTHGSEANPGLCATCHVNRATVTDAQTGDFLVSSTGHLFKAIPCVDANGVPLPGDCGLGENERSFEGCATGSCHGGLPGNARSAFLSTTFDILDRAEQLHDLLLQVDPNLDGAGGPIDGNNPEFTVAEGAFFNYHLAIFSGEGRPDERLAVASATAHNPFLIRSLLIASRQAVEREYNVTLASER